jgi:two-component system sensor histidine kinase/response regulator
MDRLEAVLLETTNVVQATLAAIVESSDDAIISTTLDHDVLTWNAGATALYGYEAEEVIGRNVSFLVPPERAEEMQVILRRIAAGEDVRHVETVRVRKDGSRVPVAVAVWPLRDAGGRLFGAASMAHDITDRLQLRADLEEARDAALRALQAKSQFLANTSHELRTPLTSIIGMNELLMRTDLDSDQRTMAEAVKRSAEKLLQTIVTVLDVSALTTGDLHLNAAEVEVRTLVAEVAGAIEPSARAKGLGFAFGVDEDAPPVVHGDSIRLRQMLQHLATNAVTFTDRGGIVIRASRPEHVEIPSVRFTVVDTGIGVAPRDQWRLFRVFSQVDSTDTRRFGGNGLGLALVAQLADAMGGAVGVASTPGRGSTFWFDIPVRGREPSL